MNASPAGFTGCRTCLTAQTSSLRRSCRGEGCLTTMAIVASLFRLADVNPRIQVAVRRHARPKMPHTSGGPR